MARGVNKVILIGRLGQDPELRYTGSGTPVCNMRLATDSSYRDGNNELVERTEWHTVVAWSRLAEITDEYLSKGSQVYIEGRLQTNQWEDNDGNTRYSTEIVARNLQFLDSRGSGQGQQRSGNQQQKPQYDNRAPQGQSANESKEEFEFEPDDDLPF